MCFRELFYTRFRGVVIVYKQHVVVDLAFKFLKLSDVFECCIADTIEVKILFKVDLLTLRLSVRHKDECVDVAERTGN